jgi:hypothetical protein
MNEGDSMNILTVRYQPDAADVGLGHLKVAAQANGFGGVSEVWSGEDQLLALASRLEAYPLPADDPPSISMCYRRPDRVDEEYLGLTFRPVGPRGQVGVEVHLAESPETRGRPGFVCDVRLELLTTYERLGRFTADLTRVVRAELDEARLEGERLG